MNRFNFFVTLVVALIATTYANPTGYGAQESGPSYAQESGPSYAQASSDLSVAQAGQSNDAAEYAPAYPQNSYNVQPSSSSSSSSSYGQSYGSQQAIPHTPKNTRGNSITSSISYPVNKGEILIHRPAAIIVKRPPTKVVVNHPPLIVKPAPVVLHKPPAVILRKVVVKHHPRPVRVEPVYVNVVKPPAERYYVNEKVDQSLSPDSLTRQSYASDNYASANGYQLVQGGRINAGYGAPAADSYGPGAPGAAY